MLSAIKRNLQLRLKAAAGFDQFVGIAAAIAATCAAAAFIFASLSGFIWLADRYDALTAGLILSGGFLGVSIAALLICVLRRRHNTRSAQRQLVVEGTGSLLALDPRLLMIGLQLTRTIGMRRLIPLAAVGLLAAMGTREWFDRDAPASEKRA